MNITDIAKARWTDQNAPRELALLVSAHLSTLAGDATLPTGKLLAALKSDLTNDEIKSLCSHLSRARAAGYLDGYFTQGKPTGGTFGKPSFRWHNERY